MAFEWGSRLSAHSCTSDLQEVVHWNIRPAVCKILLVPELPPPPRSVASCSSWLLLRPRLRVLFSFPRFPQIGTNVIFFKGLLKHFQLNYFLMDKRVESLLPGLLYRDLIFCC
jgi:hypothetical protein